MKSNNVISHQVRDEYMDTTKYYEVGFFFHEHIDISDYDIPQEVLDKAKLSDDYTPLFDAYTTYVDDRVENDLDREFLGVYKDIEDARSTIYLTTD